ncbi:Deoxyribodipyrimidine photo-lyase, partial [Stegodyphus mimosarum]
MLKVLCPHVSKPRLLEYIKPKRGMSKQKKLTDYGNPSKKQKVEEINEAETTEFLNSISSERLSCASSVKDFKFNKKRVKVISEAKDIPKNAETIVYWMSRDQRVQDNWALLYAQYLAFKVDLPVCICFCLVPKFLDATIRHYRFMLKGLQEVSEV